MEAAVEVDGIRRKSTCGNIWRLLCGNRWKYMEEMYGSSFMKVDGSRWNDMQVTGSFRSL